MNKEKPKLSHWTLIAAETALAEKIERAKTEQTLCQSVENRADWREVEDDCRAALEEVKALKALFPIRPNRFVEITVTPEAAK